jgi:hypothetical protein
LFFKQGDLAVHQVDSRFGQDIVNRAIQRYQRKGWKLSGQEQGSPFSGRMLWGVDDIDPVNLRVNITGVTRGEQAETLFFVLETNYVGGLFRYDWANDRERRIFHREGFHVRDLDKHPESELIACTRYLPNGISNVCIIQGHSLRPVTEGDSIDGAPSWIPGKEQELVFQSAGVARNAQGVAMGIGPFVVQKLDLKDGTLTTLLDDPGYDFLLPHLVAEGDVYFIRRPYEAPGSQRFSVGKFLGDILLFPYRVLRAFVHFLNFFSLTFSKKPLISAGGPRMQVEQQNLMLWGRMVDAEKALRENARGQEIPSLVPPSWELVRRGPSGDESVLARSVVAFDVDGEGRIAYTNGSAVYQLDDGKPRLLARGHLIENLVLVG